MAAPEVDEQQCMEKERKKESKSALTMAIYACERHHGWRTQTAWTNNLYYCFSYCSTCQLKPDIVLELENLEEELPHLLDASGLLYEYGDFPRIGVKNSHLGRFVWFMHRTFWSPVLDFRKKENLERLYGELEFGQIEQLIRFYQEDFDIHNYSINNIFG